MGLGMSRGTTLLWSYGQIVHTGEGYPRQDLAFVFQSGCDLELVWKLFFERGGSCLFYDSAELRSPKSLFNQLVHKPGDSKKASFDVTLILFTAGCLLCLSWSKIRVKESDGRRHIVSPQCYSLTTLVMRIHSLQ